MKTSACLLLGAALPALAYNYYYSDPLTAINASAWQVNGVVNASASGANMPTDGTIVSKVAVPDGTSEYEIKATITLNSPGGYYYLLTRASQDARLSASTATGSFYAFGITDPQFTTYGCTATLTVLESINGSLFQILSATVPCRRNGSMVLRVVRPVAGAQAPVYIDDVLYAFTDWNRIAAGQPGVAGLYMPAGNTISNVSLGVLDRTPPPAMAASAVAVSAGAESVQFRWTAGADNAGGTGIAWYALARDGMWLTDTMAPLMIDNAVARSSSYNYGIGVCDFHMNCSWTTIPVTTPASPYVNGRRTGVHKLGTYWGGMGEQIGWKQPECQ